MPFIAENPLTIPQIEKPPSVPGAGTRGLFAKRDGWYDIDSNGKTRKLSYDLNLNSVSDGNGNITILIEYGDERSE